MGRATPVRTCVGCRQRAASSDLLRVVAVGSRLVADPRHRMPGRGAHLHPRAACLDLALRRRAFARALRVAGPVDAAELTGLVTAGAATEGREAGAPARTDEQEAGSNDMSAR